MKGRNLVGERHGRLLIVARAPKELWRDRNACWFAECDCGGFSLVRGTDLKNTKSCGCYRRENTATIGRSNKGKANLSATTHGHSKPGRVTGTYRSWQAMKDRCLKEDRRDYQWYGAKGITICERWLESFENFLEDMGERPPGTSLDRIDPFGNYEPSNCRWADSKTQRMNQRRMLAKAA